jgi:hypothetical protein
MKRTILIIERTVQLLLFFIVSVFYFFGWLILIFGQKAICLHRFSNGAITITTYTAVPFVDRVLLEVNSPKHNLRGNLAAGAWFYSK